MIIKAEQKFSGLSGQKVIRLAKAIKKMRLTDAIKTLKFTRLAPAEVLAKVLAQAQANARQKNLKEENLTIKEIIVGKAPLIKRWRATARGRAAKIARKTSHIKVLINSEEDGA